MTEVELVYFLYDKIMNRVLCCDRDLDVKMMWEEFYDQKISDDVKMEVVRMLYDNDCQTNMVGSNYLVVHNGAKSKELLRKKQMIYSQMTFLVAKRLFEIIKHRNGGEFIVEWENILDGTIIPKEVRDKVVEGLIKNGVKVLFSDDIYIALDANRYDLPNPDIAFFGVPNNPVPKSNYIIPETTPEKEVL